MQRLDSEGRDVTDTPGLWSDADRLIYTPEEAAALIAEGSTVHVFLNPGGMLLGADWPRGEVAALLEEASLREASGPRASSMGHGLMVVKDGKRHFVETKPDPAQLREEAAHA